MGYSTDFIGQFDLDKPLTLTHHAYLTRFARIRHMRWRKALIEGMADPIRKDVDLPVGPLGMYFTGDIVMDESYCGKYPHHRALIDYNDEPDGVPGLWLQWEPTEDGKALKWDGGEKFSAYVTWLKFLIAHFLMPWGYTLNGRVEWQGQASDDCGVIIVENNIVMAQELIA